MVCQTHGVPVSACGALHQPGITYWDRAARVRITELVRERDAAVTRAEAAERKLASAERALRELTAEIEKLA